MGWLTRTKLKALPIIDFDEARKTLLSSAGLSTDAISKTKMGSTVCPLHEFKSICDVESYIDSVKRMSGGGISGVYYGWKRIGPYLFMFFNTGFGIRLGLTVAPTEYIVRTGQSTWKVYRISKKIQQMFQEALDFERNT